MSEIDDERARRSAERVSAGVERYFLIFRAGPIVIFPIGAIVLLTFLSVMSGLYYRLWGVPVLVLALFCFAKAYTERLPRTKAVLDEGAAYDDKGRHWVTYGWVLSLVGFVGPIIT